MISSQIRLTAAALCAGAALWGVANVAAASPSPAPSPTIATIGGPNDALSHTKVTLGPKKYGVFVSLTPIVVTARVGDPIPVSLWIANATDAPRSFCAGDFYNDLRFDATDSHGHAVATRTPPDREKAIPIRCSLSNLVQWRYVIPLSDFITVSEPGDYEITARLHASVGYRQSAWLPSNIITLHVNP